VRRKSKVRENKAGILRRSNTEPRSRNHCWYGNAIFVTYSECVVIALVIQNAKFMYRIVICGQVGCTVET